MITVFSAFVLQESEFKRECVNSTEKAKFIQKCICYKKVQFLPKSVNFTENSMKF